MTKKKQMRFASIIVVAQMIFGYAFSVACLIVFAMTGTEPDTLIKYVFWILIGGELTLTALIRIFGKIKKREPMPQEETEVYDDGF